MKSLEFAHSRALYFRQSQMAKTTRAKTITPADAIDAMSQA